MMKKNIIKSFLFILILLIFVLCIRKVISSPRGTQWATQTGMEEAIKHKNTYDVCFIGTSMIIANISNQELYEKYGIAGISIGEPEQPIYLSKYTLEEFLQYQNPQVVFLDTRALFYSDKRVKEITVEKEDYIVHQSLDPIKTFDIKQKALQDVKEYKEKDNNIWDYYSKYYYSHENWKNITYKNFEGYASLECMNGNIALFDICEWRENWYDLSNPDDKRTIDDSAERYFAEMVDMCQNEQTELILITGYVDFDKAQHNACMELAQKYGIKYIDINEHIEDIGFLFKSDIHDGWHFNLSGAIKWTDYLGDYLTKNYTFSNIKNDKPYDWYKEQTEIYMQQKEMIRIKQMLLSIITFDDYLVALKNLNHYENAIFISVYDEASTSFTEAERNLFYDLGLSNDLTGKYWYSYTAAIYENVVNEEISADKRITISGSIGDIDYKVTSGGLTAGTDDASISINQKEYMQKGRGFNIVVYNIPLNQVISSVYFDTCALTNPPQSKHTTKTVNQYEVLPNIWETEQ